jgi:hypothetical protein
MNTQQLHDLARMGAQSRLAALDQERDAILKIFPDLRNGKPAARKAEAAPKAGRDHLSPEARQRQAERMRAYWAERKAQKAGADDGSVKAESRKSSGKAAKSAKPKGGMSAEARKAQAERMKAFWAAKRAEKQTAADNGGQAEATNGTSSSKKQGWKSGRKAGRKQGRKS